MGVAGEVANADCGMMIVFVDEDEKGSGEG